MGKDWRYGRKARRKLSAPKIKKHRLQNLQNKKIDIKNNCGDQVII
jgi:hypothetical protein